MAKHKWTPLEVEVLRETYPLYPTIAIDQALPMPDSIMVGLKVEA